MKNTNFQSPRTLGECRFETNMDPIERHHVTEYHHTPVDRVVVTLIKKHESGVIHANSLIRSGVDFHYDFDRFQLTPWQLFSYVVDALGGSKDTGDSNAK